MNNNLVNIEAEQGLIGTLLIMNDQIFECVNLEEEDFAHQIHADIYKTAQTIIKEGKKATLTTIRHLFENRQDLEQVGGFDYIVELVTECPLMNTASEYAKIIKDLSTRRKMIYALDLIKNRIAVESAKPEEILSEISIIIDEGQTHKIKTKKMVDEEAIMAVVKPLDCYSSGIPCIDRAMGGGLYAGFTYGIGGAEKRGKTTLAHTISHNLNSQNVIHAYIALEMGSTQIEQRNIAREMGINSLRFLQQDSRTSDFIIRCQQAAEKIPDSTLYIDMPGATLDELQAQLSRLVIKHKIKGFVVDYWQLIEGQQRGETEEKHLRRTAQWIANFARKHKIWCILLSQVNDEGKLFAGKGLVKACDQLYTIEKSETGRDENEIWLKMTHSRYTPLADVGSPDMPVLRINKRCGPYVEQIH